MTRYVPIFLFLFLSSGLFSQTYTHIDSLVWEDETMGATSGITVEQNDWLASGTNSDATGFFGVSGTRFLIRDYEGTTGCLCEDGISMNCGENDNSIAILSVPTSGFCEVKISFQVSSSGNLECGGDPNLYTEGSCPSDLGASWNGGDFMFITANSPGLASFATKRICGDIDTGLVELFLDVASFDAVLLNISVGTQETDEFYSLGNIIIEGIVRDIPALNPQLTTPNQKGFNTICENNGNPIRIDIASSTSFAQSIDWVGPNGNSITTNPDGSILIPTYDTSNSGVYKVTVVENSNCTITDSLTLTILPASDSICRPTPVFDIFSLLCSDNILPDADINGVTGTWLPSDTLELFAGMTLEFTFVPDDTLFTDFTQIIDVFDLSEDNPPAIRPIEIPVFCNGDPDIVDLIDLFSMNLDYNLTVSGDISIFDAIRNDVSINTVREDYENFTFQGVLPDDYSFFIEGSPPCFSEMPPIRVRLTVRVIGSNTRFIIDSLCTGDFLFDSLTNTIIFRDTVITSGPSACDTLLIANITELTPQVSTTIHQGADIIAECGEVVYFYDTLDMVTGVNGVFIAAHPDDPAPLGPDFDVLFTETYIDPFLLPYPASNGCDSITQVSLLIGIVDSFPIPMQLCEFQDSTLNLEGTDFLITTNNADTVIIFTDALTGDCNIYTVDAQFQIIQKDTFDFEICASDSVEIEGMTFDFGNRAATFELPNGFCNRLVVVDLSVNVPEFGTIDTVLCRGQSILVGRTNFTTEVTGVNVPLDIPASDGCDSIVNVTITYEDPPTSILIDPTICPDSTLVFLGQNYDDLNSSGLDTIRNGNGCDSILYTIDISFFTDSDAIMEDTFFCANQSIFYPEYGVTLDSANFSFSLPITSVNGCSQTVIFTATVFPVKDTMVFDTICAGEIIPHGIQNLFTTGIYIEPFTTSKGCDSMVTLNLLVREPVEVSINETFCAGGFYLFGSDTLRSPRLDTLVISGGSSTGCDSTVNLTLSIDPLLSGSISRSTCTGQAYDFNGMMLTVADQYRDTTQTVEGCDSVTILNLTFEDILEFEFSDSQCTGQAYDFNGMMLTVADQYRDTTQTVEGCDSVTILNLTFDDILEFEFSDSQCIGQAYDFNGMMLTVADQYRDTTQTVEGCDSVTILNLTFEDILEFEFSDSQCTGQAYDFNGMMLTVSDQYRDTTQTVEGCDSVTILNLTFKDILEFEFSDSQCTGQAYDFNGGMLTVADQYRDTTQTVDGCDSITILNLTFTDVLEFEFSDSQCIGQAYDFNGMMLTVADQYRDTTQTVDGCDSVTILNLTFTDVLEFEFSDSQCIGQAYDFNGMMLTVADQYRDTTQTVDGCDSVTIVNLTFEDILEIEFSDSQCIGQAYDFNGMMLTVADQYRDTTQTVDGCDSITILNLTFTDVLEFEFSDSQCIGQAYDFNGMMLTVADQYRDTTQTVDGCDSVTIVNLTFDDILEFEFSDSQCIGQAYDFNGMMLTVADQYRDTTQTVDGCDRVTILNLTFDDILEFEFSDSQCIGQAYDFNGMLLTVADQYRDTTQTVDGCDSVTILNLTFTDVLEFEFSDSQCIGQAYDFNGRMLTVADQYRDTTLTVDGCDSVTILNLAFTDVLEFEFSDSHCIGQAYDFNGMMLTVADQYRDTIVTSDGCDSVTILNLTFDNVITFQFSDSICQGLVYPFGSQLLDTPGTYQDTTQTPGGCDSITTINFSFSEAPIFIIQETICTGEVFTINGVDYSTQEVIDIDFVSFDGCDSIVRLDLTVIEPVINRTIEGLNCAGESFVFGGITYTETTFLEDTLTSSAGCDSIVILDLFVPDSIQSFLDTTVCPDVPFILNAEVLTTEGLHPVLYQAQNRCDSIVWVNLRIVEVTDTSILNVILCPGEVIRVFNNTVNNTTGREETEVFMKTYNNSSSMCPDSVVHLTAVLVALGPPVLNRTICFMDEFVVGPNREFVHTTPGFYRDTLLGFYGCDSIVRVDLNVKGLDTIPINPRICEGGTFQVGDSILSTQGMYIINVSTQDGCDSTVLVDLEVGGEFIIPIGPITLCQGETFTVGTSTYDTTGVYMDTLASSIDCDSIISTSIVVISLTESTLFDTICAGEIATQFDRTYNESVQDSFVFQSDSGCDSIKLFYILTVLDGFNGTVFGAICPGDSFRVGNTFYTEPGVYTDSLVALSTGCDSVLITTLEFRNAVINNTSAQICSGTTFDFGGMQLDQPGIYVDTIRLVNGCDSIIELTLSVVDQIRTDSMEVICAGETFPWQGLILDRTDVYIDTFRTLQGCDSLVTLDLTVLEELSITTSNIIGSCEGVANGSFVIEGIPGATPPFSVTGLAGITTISNLPFTVTGLDTNTYIFNLTDMNGCTVGDSVTITSERSGALQIIETQISATGQYQLDLSFDGGAVTSIVWDNVPGLSCYDCPNPMVDISGETTFTVTVIDEDGCANTASITLDADPFNVFYVGNAIRPGDMGDNNRFYISSTSNSEAEYDMRVYDRWGNLIFEVSNAPVNEKEAGWDGMYKGKELNPGVFVFSAVIRENGFEKVLYGDILVVK